MKLSGDVSKEDQELARQLDAFEHEIDNSAHLRDQKAQFYTCLAHDWYQLGADEEGNRLLLKAEGISPGYFRGPVLKQQLENQSFDRVVKNITLELIKMFVDTVGTKNS